MIHLALYQPDIPQNTGTILRLGACFSLPVHIIHPASFALSDRNLKRAGMDYIDRANLTEHDDWTAFAAWRNSGDHRLIALTTAANRPYTGFSFRSGDVLLLGRESAGLPEAVHETADARLAIPMAQGARSLNVALAAGIVAAEALRQLDGFPDYERS
ncbi:MAG TPA: tRNA (cytidine(34)-2'-O)-methyltransferase [Afifellaceae bacterium]|nr:tRNA (cytidine(34)-2'-O)-methyltransferase [Afifellaceae bacterium]